MERLGKKEDTSAQISRQNDDKSAMSSYFASNKSADEDLPPNDLLCPLCKRVYTDAVIAPCCSHSFCDSCKFNKLVSYVISSSFPFFFSQRYSYSFD